jgi:membrane protease YdiL (CAAX protease family)
MRAILRAVELLVVFVAVPVALRFVHLGRGKLLILLAVTVAGFAVLLADRSFDRRELGGRSLVPPEWRGIALRALAAAAVVAGVVWLRHAAFLGLPRDQPRLWLVILVFYPFVSAWPQELLYRTFFFHRYAGLLGRRGTIVASAVAFSVLHLVFRDWIAPVLTLPMGAVLAHRYAEHRRLAPVWIEHALYGTAVFTLGLGAAFFVSAAS